MGSTEYSQSLYELSYGDGIEHYWWHLARNRIIFDVLCCLGVAKPNVLDVGCGRGIAVKYLRDRGMACAGVELGMARALESVRSNIRYGIDAVDLPEHERTTYDVIMLLDVIEHLPDPVAFVGALLKAFPRLTHLIVTVPACPRLWSNYDETFGHYRRYTMASVKEFARALHLDIRCQSYFFHSLYVPARILAALKKNRTTRVQPPQGLRKQLQRLFAWAMWLDYRIVPATVPGMSAIASLRVR